MMLHRIPVDQMYHYHLGGPLEVLMLPPKGEGSIQVIGPQLDASMNLQLLIPAGTFHISRLQQGASFCLLSTTEWGGVEPKDLEIGKVEQLQALYPSLSKEIALFSNRDTFTL
jgi:predicted cupin superfamily sugar epimerase